MNQLISVYELINLYLNHNSDQKTSPEYTQKLKNQYKTTFFLPTVIGAVKIVTCCANAAQICSKVVANAIDVYLSDNYVLVFLGLASSGQVPLFFKALDDAVEGILMREPQIAFFEARRTLLIKSCWTSVGNLKASLFTIQISLDFLKGKLFWQICGMGDFIWLVKMTELAL